MFFTVIFGFFAYALYAGSYFVTGKVKNTNEPGSPVYTAGDLLSCFYGVVFGIFSLGLVLPNVKAVEEGSIAAKLAFDVIEREPAIK